MSSYIADNWAEAIWTNSSRTLNSGSADPPADSKEYVAYLVWTAPERVLTNNDTSPPTLAEASITEDGLELHIRFNESVTGNRYFGLFYT